jgi:hypothetical protein
MMILIPTAHLNIITSNNPSKSTLKIASFIQLGDRISNEESREKLQQVELFLDEKKSIIIKIPNSHFIHIRLD